MGFCPTHSSGAFDQPPFFTFSIFGCSVISCKYFWNFFRLTEWTWAIWFFQFLNQSSWSPETSSRHPLLYLWSSFGLEQPGRTIDASHSYFPFCTFIYIIGIKIFHSPDSITVFFSDSLTRTSTSGCHKISFHPLPGGEHLSSQDLWMLQKMLRQFPSPNILWARQVCVLLHDKSMTIPACRVTEHPRVTKLFKKWCLGKA